MWEKSGSRETRVQSEAAVTVNDRCGRMDMTDEDRGRRRMFDNL